jgi:hypothetical protein
MAFEPMIAVFERAKTPHVIDRAATLIGNDDDKNNKNNVACAHS